MLLRGTEVLEMVGYITTRHLVTHRGTILREFGPRAYLRCIGKCLFSGRPTTFLECVCTEN